MDEIKNATNVSTAHPTFNIFAESQDVIADKALQSDKAKQRTSENDLELLNDLIKVHRGELEAVENILAAKAEKLTRLTSWIKVFIILLGALVATKEVANQLLGTSNAANILLYTVIGLLIATITGIETAFKWENRSAEMRALATTCRITKRQTASQLTEISTLETDDEKLADVKKLLETLDTKLDDIQAQAATLGMNTVHELQKRYPARSK